MLTLLTITAKLTSYHGFKSCNSIKITHIIINGYVNYTKTCQTTGDTMIDGIIDRDLERVSSAIHQSGAKPAARVMTTASALPYADMGQQKRLRKGKWLVSYLCSRGPRDDLERVVLRAGYKIRSRYSNKWSHFVIFDE